MNYHGQSDFPIAPLIAVVVVGLVIAGVIFSAIAARKRREALFCELETLGGQVWMTGADPALFASLESRADVLKVVAGQIMQD